MSRSHKKKNSKPRGNKKGGKKRKMKTNKKRSIVFKEMLNFKEKEANQKYLLVEQAKLKKKGGEL